MPDATTDHQPDEAAITPKNAHDTIQPAGEWQGPTYYGRSQLKQAPFENWVVGGYIFLAAVSGSSALLSAIADTVKGSAAAATVRRGRYLSLLAPTIGSALLVYDLHTPKRFYNMLRIAKKTSPMSIGTWILMTFSAFAGVSAGAQFAADRWRSLGWLRRVASVTQIPAAAAGAGLSTYTASLLSATSTPLWAAAPMSMAVRFSASSIAVGASALSVGETSAHTSRVLETLTAAALVTELVATAASHETYRRTGVDEALDGGWGKVESLGGTGVGIVLPLGLQIVSLLARRRMPTVAAVAVLAGSLMMRVAIMSAGDESASRPEISFRFAQPENLPENRRSRVRRQRRRVSP